jgi:hypothetical protein
MSQPRKPLYKRIEERFVSDVVLPEIEKRNKKLEEIKNNSRINYGNISSWGSLINFPIKALIIFS